MADLEGLSPLIRKNIYLFFGLSSGLYGEILFGILTREDGTDTLSRKVGKQLPHDAV
jgi:hypothetical protein